MLPLERGMCRVEPMGLATNALKMSRLRRGRGTKLDSSTLKVLRTIKNNRLGAFLFRYSRRNTALTAVNS